MSVTKFSRDIIVNKLGNLGYQIKKKNDPFEDQIRIFKDVQESELVIFDIGANIGQTATQYRALFSQADIYCFEPFPNSLEKINNLFDKDPKVHVINKAVADKKGNSTFYVNEVAASNSLLPRTSTERRYYPKRASPKTEINVETICIDDFMAEKNIPAIDILKFDIQGGELNALHGAKKLLENNKASIIYSEIMFVDHYKNAPLFHEIWSFLSSYGYSLYNMYDLTRASNGQIRYGDAIFVNNNIRENVINKFPDEP